jgi:tRNA(Ile)-lysidine synthase
VSELLEHVEASILARRLIRPGQRVLVAVSGGVDSMVLLHVLHELGRKQRWRLTVAHFNHRLRGESSDADERLVRHTAQKLGVPVVVEGADVRALGRAQGLSLEMAARELRHDFLARAARRRHILVVALAHHADDRLELFFMRLLRGSGGEGLAGIKWRNPSPRDARIQLIRPLLDQPKALLGEYAAERRIRFREDASNALLDFQRNRIRHELLPLLRRKYQPALDRTVSRVMEIVGAEAAFAGQVAREWVRDLGNSKADEVRASLGRLLRGERGERQRLAFDDLPVAVQRRCLQVQLLEQGVEPDFELVERLRAAAGRPICLGGKASELRGRPLAGREQPFLRYATRDRSGRLQLQVAVMQEFSLCSQEVDLEKRAGEVEFDGTKVSWRVDIGKAAGRARVPQEWFDADRVGSRVRLRHWQPGDRFQPIGMAHAVKLQDFFTNQKVPRERRRRLLLATTAGGEVFWVEGLRISERFKLTGETKRRLQWRWKRL